MLHHYNNHDEGTHEVPSWQKPTPVRAKRTTRKSPPELLFLLGLFGAVVILFAAVTAPF